MIGFIVWIIIVIAFCILLLAVARSILAWPFFQPYSPYTNTITALIVLLVFLIAVSMFYGGAMPSWGTFPGPRKSL